MYNHKFDAEISENFFPELSDIPKTEQHIRFETHRKDDDCEKHKDKP